MLTKTQKFPKAKQNPLVRLFINGISNYEGHEWAKRRKLLNPAFHIQKLKACHLYIRTHLLLYVHNTFVLNYMIMHLVNFIKATGLIINLQYMLPAMDMSCSEMISEWDSMVSAANGTCELDVWPSLQTLTKDIISRTAFGSSYQQGSTVFELQKQQVHLAITYMRSVYIPGSR